MLAVTKVKMSGSEKKTKEQDQVRHFHHKTCNRVTEVCCTYKDAFLLIRPIVVLFMVLVAFAA